jgi:topoisomerase IA-like protein
VTDNTDGLKEEPAKKVAAKKAAAKKAATKKAATKKAAARVEHPYPRRSLEEAVRVPMALKEQYGGNPRPPAEVATALGYGGPTSNEFFYVD